MRQIQYGNKNRPKNTYQEVRNAVLYAHIAEIKGFAETDPNTLQQVLAEGTKIDPTVVGRECPEFLPFIEESLVKDPLSQTPEIIIGLVKIGADKDALLAPFLASCKCYSYRAVLEGLDVFDPEKLQEFVIAETIQEGNCKNLVDFAKYTPTFDAEKYTTIFMEKKDIRGIFKLADAGLLNEKEIDDQIFSAAQLFESFDPDDIGHTPEDHVAHNEAMENLFTMLQVMGNKADLGRIETMLIKKDTDMFMHEFCGMFQDREAIPDYLAVKEIMNS